MFYPLIIHHYFQLYLLTLSDNLFWLLQSAKLLPFLLLLFLALPEYLQLILLYHLQRLVLSFTRLLWFLDLLNSFLLLYRGKLLFELFQLLLHVLEELLLLLVVLLHIQLQLQTRFLRGLFLKGDFR